MKWGELLECMVGAGEVGRNHKSVGWVLMKWEGIIRFWTLNANPVQGFRVQNISLESSVSSIP